jgi:hypothetical protein
VRFATRYTFADRSSARDFETKKRAFEELHKHRDSQYTLTQNFDVSSHEIPDETQEVVVWEDEVAKPRCLNTRCVAHSVALVLCCGLCFKKLCAEATMESNYTYIKRIYSHAHTAPTVPVASHVVVVRQRQTILKSNI